MKDTGDREPFSRKLDSWWKHVSSVISLQGWICIWNKWTYDKQDMLISKVMSTVLVNFFFPLSPMGVPRMFLKSEPCKKGFWRGVRMEGLLNSDVEEFPPRRYCSFFRHPATGILHLSRDITCWPAYDVISDIIALVWVWNLTEFYLLFTKHDFKEHCRSLEFEMCSFRTEFYI